MIRREPEGATDNVKVTFAIVGNGSVDPIAVTGDFNDWDPAATVLARHGTDHEASVVVESGRRCAFRYLARDGRWFNDEAADDYQANDHGGNDSVVDQTSCR